jgi:hypothetical protein
MWTRRAVVRAVDTGVGWGNPMQALPMHLSPRCGASNPEREPVPLARNAERRCRMHGGKSSALTAMAASPTKP